MKKQLKLWLCIILSVIITSLIITDTLAEDLKTRPEKIDISLWEYMQTAQENELIPINIALCGVEKELVLEKFKAQTGLDAEIFRDDARFENEVEAKVRSVLEKALGHDQANKVYYENEIDSISADVIENFKNALSNELKSFNIDANEIIEYIKKGSPISIVDYTIIRLRQNFETTKNKILKEEQTKRNNDFIAVHVKNRKSTVTYAGGYIPSIFLSATKEDIMYYIRQKEVVNICYAPECQITPN